MPELTTYRPPPRPGDAEPPRGARDVLLRAASALGAGAIASLVAALPAAARVAEGGSFFGDWLAIAACAVVPAILGVLIGRGAREGLRAYAGPGASIVAVGLVGWLVATFAMLAVFGALLRATTHHHGLAGVTFALLGLAGALALALVTRRFVAIASAASSSSRTVLAAALFLALALLVAVVLRAVFRADPARALPDAITGSLIDALALVMAAGFASRGSFSRVSWLARAGLPLALGLAVVGGATLARSPSLSEGIRAHAPLFSPVAALFEPPR